MTPDRSRDDRSEPRAMTHPDGVTSAPLCTDCGATMQLVMLERFTGWWCPSEEGHSTHPERA